MSILTEYVKAIYIENVLKLINLFLRVELRGIYFGTLRETKKSLAIMIKNKKINC